MRMTSLTLLAMGLVVLTRTPSASSAPGDDRLVDNTLVAWVAPATLDQGGGSALTIDNGDGAFDGIVFGELEPKRWMPGSNGFSRTEKKQAQWPAETASATDASSAGVPKSLTPM